MNTSKPTRVDVATYVYESLANDERKMKDSMLRFMMMPQQILGRIFF